MKIKGEGWYHILKHNEKLYVNGKSTRDTITLDGIEFEVGDLPRKTELWLRFKKRKKIWEEL